MKGILLFRKKKKTASLDLQKSALLRELAESHHGTPIAICYAQTKTPQFLLDLGARELRHYSLRDMVSKTLEIDEGATSDRALFLKGKMSGNNKAFKIKIVARRRNRRKYNAMVTIGDTTYGERVITIPQDPRSLASCTKQ